MSEQTGIQKIAVPFKSPNEAFRFTEAFPNTDYILKILHYFEKKRTHD